MLYQVRTRPAQQAFPGVVRRPSSMMRLALQVAYDGTPYRGWTDVRDTHVRPTLSRVLHGDASAMPLVEAASRTDAGVHARGQVCSTLLSSAREVREADVGQLCVSQSHSAACASPAPSAPHLYSVASDRWIVSPSLQDVLSQPVPTARDRHCSGRPCGGRLRCP